MKTKICTKCGKEYPRTKEYFPLHKDRKDGLGSWCRGCQYAEIMIWRERNKEKCGKYIQKFHKTLKGYVSQLMGRIKQRCINPNCKSYKYYGGRGIRCEFTGNELYIWLILSRINPRGFDIHRIDNDGNYTLDNIEFLTRSKHMRLHHSNKGD